MPAKFTDRHGREWGLTLTVADLKPLRDDLKFDVTGLASGEQIGRVLYGDPEGLVAVLHLLAKPTGVTPDEFADGFDGPALERAGEALLEAFADFFPRSRIAHWMKTAMRERMAEFDRQVIRSLSSSDDVTNSPGPPECPTPAP